MKTNTGENMTGAPIGTPGSAEGVDEEKGQDQSQTPPAAHTPGSAEGDEEEEQSE